jgi:HD-GYP domain-containing protein (c-di-GMP phosphodiesterase class II)
MTLTGALRTVETESGRHFDPEVVAAFKGIAPALYAVFHNADDSTLRSRLQDVLSRYFTAEGASGRAIDRPRTSR